MERRHGINRALCAILTDTMVESGCIDQDVQRFYCICGDNPESTEKDYTLVEEGYALHTIFFIQQAVKEKLAREKVEALAPTHHYGLPGGTGI